MELRQQNRNRARTHQQQPRPPEDEPRCQGRSLKKLQRCLCHLKAIVQSEGTSVRIVFEPRCLRAAPARLLTERSAAIMFRSGFTSPPDQTAESLRCSQPSIEQFTQGQGHVIFRQKFQSLHSLIYDLTSTENRQAGFPPPRASQPESEKEIHPHDPGDTVSDPAGQLEVRYRRTRGGDLRRRIRGSLPGGGSSSPVDIGCPRRWWDYSAGARDHAPCDPLKKRASGTLSCRQKQQTWADAWNCVAHITYRHRSIRKSAARHAIKLPRRSKAIAYDDARRLRRDQIRRGEDIKRLFFLPPIVSGA